MCWDSQSCASILYSEGNELISLIEKRTYLVFDMFYVERLHLSQFVIIRSENSAFFLNPISVSSRNKNDCVIRVHIDVRIWECTFGRDHLRTAKRG